MLRAVGYKDQPLAGVPFDAHVGIIPHDRGRVLWDGVVASLTPQARTSTSPGLPSVTSPFSVRAVSAWWPQ